MDFGNEGVVQADPLPPVVVKYHIFTFYLGPFPYPFALFIVTLAGSGISGNIHCILFCLVIILDILS